MQPGSPHLLPKAPNLPCKAPRALQPGSEQQNLLQQRPLLPGHGHELGDLVDGPGPDQFDQMEDRRNPLLQEFQELIENLFHGPWLRRLNRPFENPDSTWKRALGSRRANTWMNLFTISRRSPARSTCTIGGQR